MNPNFYTSVSYQKTPPVSSSSTTEPKSLLSNRNLISYPASKTPTSETNTTLQQSSSGDALPMSPQQPPPPTIPYSNQNLNKKSRIVPADKRKKIGRACDSCKKRKQKCTGLLPCTLCLSKGLDCEYTSIDRRVLKPSKKELEERRRNTEKANNLNLDPSNGVALNPASDRAFTIELEKKYPMGNARTTSKFKMPLLRRHLMSTDSINNNKNDEIISSPSVSLTTTPVMQHVHLNDGQSQHSGGAGENEIQISRGQIPLSLQPLLSFPVVNSQNDDTDDSTLNSDEGSEAAKGTKKTSKGNMPSSSRLSSREPSEPITTSEAASVETTASLQYDQSGNLVYVGQSSPTSYLLLAQSVFEQTLGPNKFTEFPPATFNESPGLVTASRDPLVVPDKEYSDYLLRRFSEHLNNTTYLISYEYLEEMIQIVYSDVRKVAPRDLCVYYLILAIGSFFAKIEIKSNIFPFPLSRYIEPVVFYETAVKILSGITNDDDNWLVETHLLIFLFHHLAGRRNTAWINLGTSIRHAHELGLNKTKVNDAFPLRYSNHRRKIFRTLYIMDRLCSMMLGRKMTINDADYEDYDVVCQFTDYQTGLLITCKLIGRVINKVYTNNKVSLKGALFLASDIKRQSAELIPKLTGNNYAILLDHRYFLPYIYHLHSVILLSRPFFHIVVMEKLGLVHYEKSPQNEKILKMFYQSCIKASLLLIRMIQFIYEENVHPYKPMNLAHSAFQAGLVVGLLLLLNKKNIDDEIFHSHMEESTNKEEGDLYKDVDIKKMLENGLASSIDIFESYGIFDVTSKKFGEVLKALKDVTIGTECCPPSGGLNWSQMNSVDGLNRYDNGSTSRTSSVALRRSESDVSEKERITQYHQQLSFNKNFFTAIPMIDFQSFKSPNPQLQPQTEPEQPLTTQISNHQQYQQSMFSTSSPQSSNLGQYSQQPISDSLRGSQQPNQSQLSQSFQNADSTLVNNMIQSTVNQTDAQERYENILKFQDWLFPNSEHFPYTGFYGTTAEDGNASQQQDSSGMNIGLSNMATANTIVNGVNDLANVTTFRETTVESNPTDDVFLNSIIVNTNKSGKNNDNNNNAASGFVNPHQNHHQFSEDMILQMLQQQRQQPDLNQHATEMNQHHNNFHHSLRYNNHNIMNNPLDSLASIGLAALQGIQLQELQQQRQQQNQQASAGQCSQPSQFRFNG